MAMGSGSGQVTDGVCHHPLPPPPCFQRATPPYILCPAELLGDGKQKEGRCLFSRETGGVLL